MLRSVILLAAESPRLRQWFEQATAAKNLTQRFVAGNTLDDAEAACKTIANTGLQSSLDSLGESVHSAEQAEAATGEYVAAIQRIAAKSLPASISLKLTQLGMDISTQLAAENLETICLASANSGGVRVEVDMEASPYVDRTLDLVERQHAGGYNVRAVIQAYLHRSRADIQRLNKQGIPVRLCKGAYKEDSSVAFPDKSAVDASYRALSTLLLEEGTFPAIATHDDRMVEHALACVARLRLPAERFEFQMLYGIRRDRQEQLARKGYGVRVYIPYGAAWYPYLTRRLAERPANLLFMLKNLFR